MGDLNSALNSAFDEEIGRSEPTSEATATPEPVKAEPEAQPEAAKAAEPSGSPSAPEASKVDETFANPTREELELIEKNPALKKAYESFRRGFSNKTRELAEERKRIEGQAQLWDALNNPETQKQAVESLARSIGLSIQPTDAPQREQATKVADTLEAEWAEMVGPEAAAKLRPLIEKTAMASIQGTIQPLQKAAEFVQQDAAQRQGDAQVAGFRALAKDKGWHLDADVEAQMASIAKEIAPTKFNPVTRTFELAPFATVDQGVKFLERCYRLATADTSEADMEKRILERMNKAAQAVEPARGIPSTGREKRTNITKEMSLSQALDVAMEEETSGLR